MCGIAALVALDDAFRHFNQIAHATTLFSGE